MAIAGGLFAMIVRLINDRRKYKTEYRVQESRLSMEESKEQQALGQRNESYQIQEIKALMRERQKIHDKDKVDSDERYDNLKHELLGILGNAEKRLDACEKDRVWLRVILDRIIRSNRLRADYDSKQEQDFFRPVEVWEKVEDDIRVEEAKKREDDSVH